MKRLLTLLLLSALPCAAQINTPFNAAGTTPLLGPSTAGPSAAGYFHTYWGTDGLTTGNIGTPSGSQNSNATAPDLNHPGVWLQATGTTSGSGVFIAVGVGGTMVALNTSGSQWYWEQLEQVLTLPGTAASAQFDGVAHSSGPLPLSNVAAGFYLSSANAVPNDWYCVTGAAGTAVDSGVAATTSWVHLQIQADGTFIHFLINGVEATGCKTTQTSTYSAGVSPISESIANTTTNVLKYINYTSFAQSNLTR